MKHFWSISFGHKEWKTPLLAKKPPQKLGQAPDRTWGVSHEIQWVGLDPAVASIKVVGGIWHDITCKWRQRWDTVCVGTDSDVSPSPFCAPWDSWGCWDRICTRSCNSSRGSTGSSPSQTLCTLGTSNTVKRISNVTLRYKLAIKLTCG